MNTFCKPLTAAAVAVTIAATTLAAPAEAKVRGRDVAAGIALGVAAVALGAEVHVRHGRPRHHRYGRRWHGPRRGGCHWLKRKAIRTESSYWWGRYDACMGH